jgi:hypothetical protein
MGHIFRSSRHRMSTPEICVDLRAYIEERAEEARVEYMERWERAFSSLDARITREAKRILWGYLLTINDGYNEVEYRAAGRWSAHPNWGTIVTHSIEISSQPVPFVFIVCHESSSRILCVTLDESAERMRDASAIKRDRALIDASCHVLNFSDHEVMEHPQKIAEQVSSELSELCDDLLAEAGIIAARRNRKIISIGSKTPPSDPPER